VRRSRGGYSKLFQGKLMTEKKGKIILVGAGPGDPGLVTVRGKQAIEQAEVLVYDYLVHPALLDYAPEDCEKIYVGKRAGCHTMRQEEINSLLVEKAGGGKVVVRLKGGDPFVFGRGGEEALAASEAGVRFEVVPGVTAGVAVPAFAGIPVTQRGITSTVAFITGHEDPQKEESDIDWSHLARFSGTLVFYMGVGRLAKITGKLIEHGAPPQTPVAVIHRGTTEEQKTVAGTLENIEKRVNKAGIKPPAVIVVGRVVELRERLNWFESAPLFGRTVLVTRAREQASDFSRLLKNFGARVIEMPTIKIVDSPEPEAVCEAVGRLGDYDWIVFTSVNGVKRLFSKMREAGLDVRAFGSASLAAIGPATAGELESSGLKVELVPDSYVAEAVVDAFKSRGDLAGKKVLLPRAQEARKVLPEALRGLGAEVDEIALYSTRIEKPENLEEVRKDLASGSIDVVTFTSSSTVHNFVELIGKEEVSRLSGKMLFAAIGPVTAETAKTYGLGPLILPREYTIEALAMVICNHFAKQS